jgi:SAM-dependent methyltransferase
MDVREGPLRKASRRHGARPNFAFHHADLRNRRYNEQGGGDARGYRFPAADASVDLVVLRSVFTHMLPPEIEHYVTEIARVLRPGGAAYVTAYLLNEESSAFVEGRSADQPGSFPHNRGDHRVRFEDVPEHAVALAEDFVRRVFAEHGLSIREPILYGSWCGRAEFLSRQDVVVAVR